ncbi:MAG: M23 family metallopeptidase [Cyanobacteria bacterium P01_G01_bin.19]
MAWAIDISTQVKTDKTNKVALSNFNSHEDYTHTQEHNYLHHSHASGFLPRILNMVGSPFLAHLNRFAQTESQKQVPQSAFYPGGVGGSLTQDLTQTYLEGLNSASSNKEFLAAATIKLMEPSNFVLPIKDEVTTKIYTVKRGDTLARIAERYQVSRQELVALNKINNSNLIFVNQKLKLPATAVEPVEPAKITLTQTNFPQSSIQKSLSSGKHANSLGGQQLPGIVKLDKKDKTSLSDLQAKRLDNLKADIARMRSQMQQEKNSEEVNLESVDNLESADVISSINPQTERISKSISESDISVNLPPLPPSDEYLPEAFEGYSWPAQGVLSSGYGWRWGRLHKGIDIAAPVGTPIFAAASGEVISAGWNSGGYGNLVKLQHLDGSMTLYAHNNRILVSNGQRVRQGEQIAEMGNTGFSTGSHLHFEIHSKNRGVVNPLALLSKN